jgi:hypothetical protein
VVVVVVVVGRARTFHELVSVVDVVHAARLDGYLDLLFRCEEIFLIGRVVICPVLDHVAVADAEVLVLVLLLLLLLLLLFLLLLLLDLYLVHCILSYLVVCGRTIRYGELSEEPVSYYRYE